MRKKIKILYTIPNFDTAGSGKALLKIAERLDREWFEPHIMCLHDKGEFFKVVLESGIPVHVMDYMIEPHSRLKAIASSWKLSRRFKQMDFDLIHSFHWNSDWYEPLTARFAGVKWIYTKKNMSWGGVSKRNWYLRTKLATWVVMQNQLMQNLFFKGLKKSKLIRRGVDLEEFYPRQKDQGVQKEFSLKEDDKVIICVAFLTPVKKIEVLINAFGLLPRENPYKLLIIGDNDNVYGDELERSVKTLNLTNKVVFVGKRLNIAEFHSIADLFVLPSRMESSPVALLEAMACGTIPLGSRTSGIEEILRPFPDLLFESGNSLELSRKIEKYLVMPESERIQLKEQLVKYAHQSFSLDLEVQRHMTLYRKLTSSR